jgi:hypothetical protein
MPNQDGTGPMGLGSRTGRIRGNCKSPLAPNPSSTVIPVDARLVMQPKGGRGNGCGCGGRGRGHKNSSRS